jgi:uncharacterized protein (DUF2384 family)
MMPTATSNDLLEALSGYELGPFELAAATGASTRSVERWLAGHARPQRAPTERLADLAAVLDALRAAAPGANAGAWLLTPSRALDYARPAEAIRAGRATEVLAFLEAIAEGVYI